MEGLRAFGVALIALAAPASQDAGQAPAPPAAAAAAAAGPAVQDVALEIGGVRARVVLKSGVAMEGLLPDGVSSWEKPAPSFDYQGAEASDPAAGLRLYFVFGMEGAIFVRKADIAEVKDLGAVSDEAAAAIRQRLLDERRRVVEERQARIKEIFRKAPGAGQEEPKKQAGPAPETAAPEAPGAGAPATAAEAPPASPSPAPAPVAAAPAGPLTKEDAARAKAEARRVRGEELLAKYPPPDWSESRLQTILWREQVAKIPPDEVEAPWIKENDVWLEALRRREAAEKKAAAGAAQGAAAPAGAGNPAPR